MIAVTPPAAAAAPVARDPKAVAAALLSLDAAIGASDRAVAIPLPKGGLFGDSDAKKAAIAQRAALLVPAAKEIEAAAELLKANGGYGVGYRYPVFSLGDNGQTMVSISKRASEHPDKFKWVNDFPWQDAPTTDLAQMVGYVTEAAGQVTREEVKINVSQIGALTGATLYANRAQELEPSQLQGLSDAIAAVQSIRSSRFMDEKTTQLLDTVPREVLGADGKLTTDPTALAALEQLHRTTVQQRGGQAASDRIAAQLATAAQLAAAGDTAAAREIYDRLGVAA